MKISGYCKSYFNYNELVSNFKSSNKRVRLVALLTLASYVTLVIPASISVIYGLNCLYSRIVKKHELTFRDKKVKRLAVKHTPAKHQIVKSLMNIPICDANCNFSKRLSRTQNPEMKILKKSDDNDFLEISFESAEVKFFVKITDIYDSEADVVVCQVHHSLQEEENRSIIDLFGDCFKDTLTSLRDKYQGYYSPGHAAMVRGGALEEKQIDHLILVTEPQSEVASIANNELYSCYFNSLTLAESKGLKSIAFPPINTHSYSEEEAIILRAVYDFVLANPNRSLKDISIHYHKKEIFDSYIDSF